MQRSYPLKETVLLLFAFLCIASLTVGVSAQSPVADFTGTPQSGSASLNVQFTDTSTNFPNGWAWFFGDETYTAPWTQMTSSAGWSARSWQSSLAMPDGSIVLMGGGDNKDGNSNFKNDVWRSTDKGATWTRLTANAGWSARAMHSSVVMPDGSIVLMGGVVPGSLPGALLNDVWRSTDNGATWTEVNANAPWSPRCSHTSVAMPDGSIILMGGQVGDDIVYINDVWKSTDNGVTWTRMTASAGWSARASHSSVTMPDSSIVLMGGYDGNFKNDVWRSTNNGATWTQMTEHAGWSARHAQSSGVMPDSSIVLMGSAGIWPINNDVWRSTDKGATWTRLTANAGWLARISHSSVVIPDGSIVLMGGYDGSRYLNDVWRFMPTGSSAQNPSHTYTKTGLYTVSLQAYNSTGYSSIIKTGYITVTITPSPTPTTSPTTTPTQSPSPTPEPGVPKASFAANPKTGNPPLVVSFQDLSSGSPTSWSWTFGDGITSTERNPSHTYLKAGIYSVKLKVSAPSGTNGLSRSGYIIVSNGPIATPTTTPTPTSIPTVTPTITPTPSPTQSPSPTPVPGILKAGFTANPKTGNPPLAVSFQDLSSGSPTSWSWTFGDGITSTEQNPRHTYLKAGMYSVKLKVSAPSGTNGLSRSGYIVVSNSEVTPTTAPTTKPTTVPTTTVTTSPTSPPVTDFTGSIEQIIYQKTNAERMKNGAKPLVWSNKLAATAKDHSFDMIQRNFFDHLNPSGENPTARALRHGYVPLVDGGGYYIGVGENLHKLPTGQMLIYCSNGDRFVANTPESIANAMMDDWMNHDTCQGNGHRNNILDPNYGVIGIGVTFDGTNYLCTQDFG